MVRTYKPADARKREILEASRAEFVEKGYAKGSIGGVCGRLGIARGTLYQYFEGKRGLMEALLEEVLGRLDAATVIPPEYPSLPVTRETAIRLFAEYLVLGLEAVFRDEATLRLLVHGGLPDAGLRTLLSRIDAICVQRCTQTIAFGQALGAFDADIDPRTVSLITLGSLQKLALDGLDRGEPVDLERLARQLATALLFGIARREALDASEGEGT